MGVGRQTPCKTLRLRKKRGQNRLAGIGMSVRIVVAGGSGFVGRALTHALLARGDRVQILTRGPGGFLTHHCRECGPGGRLEFLNWTPDRPGPWMEHIEGADAVVSLAGAALADARFTEERKEVLKTSRLTSTKMLVQAIAQAKDKPKAFVAASAVKVYGMKTGDAPVSEAEPLGCDFLAKLAVECENAAMEAGVRTCHARLGLVLGRGGGFFARLAPLFKMFMGGPVGAGTQFVPWVHLRDVVRALEAMIDRTDLVGAYNVVSPEPVSMNELAAAFGEAFQRPVMFRLPSFAVKLAMSGETADAALLGQRALPTRLTDAGFAFVFPDVRSALDDLVSSPHSRPLAAS
jgi:hypothetical protein